jgi:hypothetical protein
MCRLFFAAISDGCDLNDDHRLRACGFVRAPEIRALPVQEKTRFRANTEADKEQNNEGIS